MAKRKCLWCKEEFEITPGVGRIRKYCSIKCGIESNAAQSKRYSRKLGYKELKDNRKYLVTPSGLEVRNDILGKTMARVDVVCNVTKRCGDVHTFRFKPARKRQ